MTFHRIRLLGATGSGKSYLAKVIADTSDLVHINLDKLIYEHSPEGKIIRKYPEQDRNNTLQKMLSHNRWIVEGTYYQNWATSSFEQADLILILNIPRHIRYWRIIKRAIQYRYSLPRLIMHLKYSYRWEKKHKAKAFETLEPFLHKVREINSFHEAFRLINHS